MNTVLRVIFVCFCFSLHAANNEMSPERTKRWLQEALYYEYDLKTTDYAGYISRTYVEHFNGKLFNYSQWAKRMAGFKELMGSIQIIFDEIVVERDKIGTSYHIRAIKKDGTELDIRVFAIYKIKDEMIYYCDELNYLIRGSKDDREQLGLD
jgi:hypothetical protein